MPPRRSARDRNALTVPTSPSTRIIGTTRTRRAAAAPRTPIYQDLSEAEESGEEELENYDTDDYGDNQAGQPRKTLRLTVKMPSSRLREVASSTTNDEAAVPPGRSTRKIKKSYVVETSSEDDEDDEPETYEQVNSKTARKAVPDALQEDDEDSEEVEEDDDLDAEGDIDMDEYADEGTHPLPPTQTPILKVNPPAAPKSKPKVTVTPAQDTKLKSLESREMDMEDDDDDEELSELVSDAEEEDEEEEEEEDAEGEDEDAEGEEADEDEDMAEGDDSRSPDLLSRGTTPDLNKMTKRQRSRLNEVLTASDSINSGFLELPMEPQVKKHLTAEEHAMRRAEMARRRKNLSEKRNEEEKQDTINRLLKKQAPKRRGKISAKEIEAQDRGDMSEAEDQVEDEAPILPANPNFARWVSNAQGCSVSVPVEWLGTPIGKVFGESRTGGRMVEEIE